MELLQQVEELLSNQKEFQIEDIFKLYTAMSHLHSYQGRILTGLLKMSASMIQIYNEEIILNKKAHSTAKQGKIQTTPRQFQQGSIIKSSSRLELLKQIDTKYDKSSVTINNQETFSLKKKVSKAHNIADKIQDPFKKKFQKVRRDHNQQRRGKTSKFEAKSIIRSKSKTRIEQYYTVTEQQSDAKQRLYKQTVRNQEQRRMLPGHLCEDCNSFLDGLSASEEYIKQWCQECSKHRGRNNIINQDLTMFPSQIT